MRINQIIAHRINSLELLKKTDKNFGAEIDIRYNGDDLILHHDPFNQPQAEKLEDFLKNYDLSGTLILNIKSEGIEKKIIELVNKYKIKDWFFLDLSMPYFVRFAKYAVSNEIEGFAPKNLAVRFSEEEPLEYALNFSDKAKWIWIDCFTKLPLDQKNYHKIKEAGFRICLVSPELQGHNREMILEFKKQLANFEIDAVCTKYPDLWKN